MKPSLVDLVLAAGYGQIRDREARKARAKPALKPIHVSTAPAPRSPLPHGPWKHTEERRLLFPRWLSIGNEE